MTDVAEIIKTVHEVFKDRGQLKVVVDERKLGMAYAIPEDTEKTVLNTYGPWKDAEVRQVFFRQSALAHVTLADIQLILSWRYSQAEQYIVDAYLSVKINALDMGSNVNIVVHFFQPRPYDFDLEAFEIPFRVDFEWRPFVGDIQQPIFEGRIRADGTGIFQPKV